MIDVESNLARIPRFLNLPTFRLSTPSTAGRRFSTTSIKDLFLWIVSEKGTLGVDGVDRLILAHWVLKASESRQHQDVNESISGT